MAQIDEIKEYLRKIQLVVKNPEFSFVGSCFVKKSRIDDLMCCLMAVLPKQFNNILKYKTERYKYVSTLNIAKLKDEMMHPFLFSKNLYVFELNKIMVYIQNIMKSIEQDIEKIEKL